MSLKVKFNCYACGIPNSREVSPTNQVASNSQADSILLELAHAKSASDLWKLRDKARGLTGWQKSLTERGKSQKTCEKNSNSASTSHGT